MISLRHISIFITFTIASSLFGQPDEGAETSRLVVVENDVEVSIDQARWQAAEVDQQMGFGDRIRTGDFSRAAVELPSGSVLRIDELSEVRLQRPKEARRNPGLDLRQGSLYFFGRDQGEENELITPTANGAIRGTEFIARAAVAGASTITLLEGSVEISNEQGSVTLLPGEQAEVAPGQAPSKTAAIDASRDIQWMLYYPAVIDPLVLSQSSANEDVLEAYRLGDLPRALDISNGRSGDTLLDATLALSAGQVDRAEDLLAKAGKLGGEADALIELISVVAGDAKGLATAPQTASQWLARSYRLQADGELAAARQAAQQATSLSPTFGYAWVRLAELEFSFGNASAMVAAISKAETFTPDNAQLHALRGFIEAGARNWVASEEAFNRAKELDGALANAWLGYGLVQIAQGRDAAGRQALQNAAALEPNRSLLRSYLAKAFTNDGLWELSEKELARAIELDPADPTPWLYSALDYQAKNQFNAGVRALEESISLNDNRQLYRSKFLLDQDRAVRGANLAQIYQQASLEERAIAQAGRAISDDYRSFSAHRFLANTFNELRDPNGINQRYEIAWLNEVFLSNIFSPIAAGNLSSSVTQQEYSSLFASTGGVLASSGEFMSDGSRELNAQAGYIGARNSLFVDFSHQKLAEFFGNDDRSVEEVNITYKHDIGEKGSLYGLISYYEQDQGDVFLGNNPVQGFRFRQTGEPSVFAAYKHEWNEQHQTIALAGRIDNHREIDHVDRTFFFIEDGFEPVNGNIDGTVGNITVFPFGAPADWYFTSESEIYLLEAQHIARYGPHELLIGARYQDGKTSSVSDYILDTQLEDDITRYSLYAYYSYRLPLFSTQLTVGITYDDLEYPLNAEDPFLLSGQDERNQFGPKLGLTMQPINNWMLRAAYARVMSGFSIDDPFRLEPTQTVGFIHTYRSIIPENLTGTLPAADIDTFHVSLDAKAFENLYLGVDYFYGYSEAAARSTALDQDSRDHGLLNQAPLYSYGELFEYREHEVVLRGDALIGDQLSTGASLSYNYVELDRDFVFSRNFSLAAGSSPSNNYTDTSSDLINLSTYVQWRAKGNWFVRLEADYWWQSSAHLPLRANGTLASPFLVEEESFPYFTLHTGYRLRNNHGEVRFTLYNLTDEQYTINGLNTFYELPRETTAAIAYRVSF